MTGAQVLVVMRDHTGVTGVSGGKMCMCGELFLSVPEHTAHVADAIAAAARGAALARRAARSPAARPMPRLVAAAALDLEQLGCKVAVLVPGLGEASGVLLRAEADPLTPGFVELELLPPGDAPTRSYLVPGRAWVEVHAR